MISVATLLVTDWSAIVSATATCVLVIVTAAYTRSTAAMARSAADATRAAERTASLAREQGLLAVQPRLILRDGGVELELGESRAWSAVSPSVLVPLRVRASVQNLGPGLACGAQLWLRIGKVEVAASEGSIPSVLRVGADEVASFAFAGAERSKVEAEIRRLGNDIAYELVCGGTDIFGNALTLHWDGRLEDGLAQSPVSRVRYPSAMNVHEVESVGPAAE